VQLQVSPAVGRLLEKAGEASIHQGQLFVGLPHVFAAILEQPDALPQQVRERFLSELFAVLRELQRNRWKDTIPAPAGEIFHTPRCIEIINRSERLARQHTGSAADAGHLLLAILADELSEPSRAMDTLKLNRMGCIAALRAAYGGGPVASATAMPQANEKHAARPAAVLGDSEAPVSERRPPELVRDLSAAAERGELHRAVGRSKEIFHILEILSRKTKNNVVLVGEAGVGKTQLVEGLAYRIMRNEESGEQLPFRILELNMAAMLAGTQYRGAFEERLLQLLASLKADPNAVLFIDELHLIMGAGATDGDGIDLANLLKPALARGELRCIGATTVQEYRKFVSKDPAIERRFQMLRIDELSEKATLRVLIRLQPGLERHHKVAISNRALKAAVTLTSRYMPNRRHPDKAIDVLDQACSRHKLLMQRARHEPYLAETLPKKVTPHEIRKVVSQLSGIPIERMTAEEREQLNDLDRRLRESLIGQDEAVTKMAGIVRKSRAGLADPKRPDAVALFVGPSGVGKTQLAKLLAEQLFGSRDHLFTFDMSEYIEEHSVSRLLGAPPGYQGAEEEGRLLAAVRHTPFCILLFDEIEKAHPRIFDIFLPIFEEGRLQDNFGRSVDFRHCIIILTSNAGADVIRDHRNGTGDLHGLLLEELRQYFRPEFINRIDEIVPFYPLLGEDLREILHLEVNEVRRRMVGRRVGIRMYQRAYEFVAREGYSPEQGARELRRAVDRYITTPISELTLRETFVPGDMIEVLEENGSLVVRKAAAKSAQGVST